MAIPHHMEHKHYLKAAPMYNLQQCAKASSLFSLVKEHLGRGRLQDALTLYSKTRVHGSGTFDVHTFVALLNACAKLKDLDRGREVHYDVARTGLLDRDIYIGSALLNMYTKCGMQSEAQELFDKLPAQDIATWNALITGYSKHGQGTQALYYFEQMKLKRFAPNAVTFMCVLKACGSVGDADKGTELHAEIERKRLLERDLLIGSALVDMYAKCGLVVRAQEVFDKLPFRTIASWSALIAGYSENGNEEKALIAFEEMQSEHISPNSVTYVCSLKACGSIKAIEKGEHLHLEIERKGLLEGNIPICNALIDMYINCGYLRKAQLVFDKLQNRDVASWNALITGYAEYNHGERALLCLIQMQLEGVLPDTITFISSLRICGNIGALDKVQELQVQITTAGFLDVDMAASSILVYIYAKHGLFQKAQELFNKVSTQSIAMWNALTSGYANHGLGREALQCLEQMQLESVSPDVVTFICTVKACTSSNNLEDGQKLHMEAEKRGFMKNDTMIGNAIVHMYAKFGLLTEAQFVFERLLMRDEISWNALVEGYIEHEKAEEAIQCIDQMQLEGLSPSSVTFLYSLKACSKLGDMGKGLEVYGHIARLGLLENNPIIGSALINMYAQFKSPLKAKELFDSFLLHNIVLWKALIAGYVDNDSNEEALSCFALMQHEGISPDSGLYVYGLKACCGTRALRKGYELHDEIIKKGYKDVDVALSNMLIVMYADFGLLAEARSVFDGLPQRDIVSWNALIAGYLKYGLASIAITCLEHIQLEGVVFNSVTFACSLNACGCVKATEKGQKVHNELVMKGLLEENLAFSTALVEMYAKFGMLADAEMVFSSYPGQDVSLWNALMVGYLGQVDEENVLGCFTQMQLEGCSPDSFTFICCLKACATTQAFTLGQQIHAVISGSHCLEMDSVVGNSLVGMYMKWGSLSEAHEVFNNLPVRDVVVWTTLIAGYTEHGNSKAALDLIKTMQSCSTFPNEVTLLCGLRACRDVGAIDMGLEIHAEIELKGLLDSNLAVSTSLVAMYVNCGLLSVAQRVFARIPVQNVLLWNALMAGYAQLGHSEEIFYAFDRMVDKGIRPDTATFAIVLSACSQDGLLDKGDSYFKAMSDFGIKPALEHHTCMVDLLGRTGALNKAAASIKGLPCPPDNVAWCTMLDACKRLGNVDIGRHAFEHVAHLNG